MRVNAIPLTAAPITIPATIGGSVWSSNLTRDRLVTGMNGTHTSTLAPEQQREDRGKPGNDAAMQRNLPHDGDRPHHDQSGRTDTDECDEHQQCPEPGKEEDREDRLSLLSLAEVVIRHLPVPYLPEEVGER